MHDKNLTKIAYFYQFIKCFLPNEVIPTPVTVYPKTAFVELTTFVFL